MKISVVVVSYRRLARLEEILAAWLKETPDVWLCDCSKEGFQTKLPVKIIRATPDPGNRIRHAVALLTSGELVIKADDDIIPLPGLAKAFAENYQKYGEAIYGVHGRIFSGPGYYKNSRLYGGKNVGETKQVHFVGVITCAPRPVLPMDLHGCASEVEDLFWQMRCYPKARKFVIATDRFRNLPECKDQGRLCGTPASRKVRREFYTRWYERNYQNNENRHRYGRQR